MLLSTVLRKKLVVLFVFLSLYMNTFQCNAFMCKFHKRTVLKNRLLFQFIILRKLCTCTPDHGNSHGEDLPGDLDEPLLLREDSADLDS